jgi:hypothetical protein
MNAASLYGVTFFDVDPSSKLDVSAKDFPRGAWYRIASSQKRVHEHAGRVNSEPIDTQAVSTAMPAPIRQPAGRVVEGAFSE